MKQHLSTSLLVLGLLGALAGCVQDPAPEGGTSGAPAKSAATGEGATSRKSAGTTSRPSAKADGKVTPAAARLDEKAYDHFGDGVAAAGESLTLAAVSSRAKELTGKKVRLTGAVKSVCKNKGCWMVLADGDNEVRITFRGYSYFVPKDCEGRTAVLEGTFEVSETSVADLKHLLEDEGKKEEAAKVTEPRVEMKVTADGVALKK